MDDQKPQDQDDQNLSVNEPVNDITPPPAEESIGQKINVISSDGNDGSELSDEPETLIEVTETAVEPVEEPADEVVSDEQLSPVAAPPEEVNTENVTEQMQMGEETAQPNNLPQSEKPTAPVAIAEMGVASSQMNSQKHPHRNNKKLAMIVTIATALILASTAVFVYMSANKNTDVDKNSEATQINRSSYEAQQKAVTPATVEGIDQVIAGMEESFSNLDDEADYNEQSFSDDTLGL